MFRNYQKIGVVCHDAGSANIILYAINKENIERFVFFLSGPAVLIFKSLFDLKYYTNVNTENLKELNVIFIGTGNTNYEKNALKKANNLKIKTISIVDHWCNYYSRFILNNELILPNEIIVTDFFAYKKLREIFMNIKITIVKNKYLENQIKKVKRFSFLDSRDNKDKLNLLYVCEPKKIIYKGKEINELDIFSSFLELIDNHQNKINSVMIRNHPSEKKDKYLNFLNKDFSFNLVNSNSNEISIDIAKADIVIGYESFGMVVALKANKKVYTLASIWSKNIILPFNEISPISDLINAI